MSLFAEYLLEKTQDQIIEKTYGFITYSFQADSCWIKDLYIKKEFRNMNKATDLADEVAEVAKTFKLKKLLGSVIPSNKGSTESVKVLLAYGMKLDSATNDFILFSKEI
jgi:hypothetical protein